MSFRIIALFVVLALSGTSLGSVEVNTGGGGGVRTYADAASLPASAADGATAVTLDTHSFYIYNLGSLNWILQSGSTGVGGPGTSVDNEIMLWSGTGGDTAKRATGTGFVKVVSGVFQTPAATIGSSEITDGTIVNADINASAGIVDTKLATISTAGKVSDSALSANVSLLGSSISLTSEVSGTLPIANGGTGQTSASAALSALGGASSGDNTDITSLTLGNGATRCVHGDSDTGFCFTSDGEIVFTNNGFQNFATSQNYVAFEGVPYVFPGDNGDPDEVLTTDGAGNLSWSPVSIDSIALNQFKDTTTGQTMNSIHVDWDPTGAGDNVSLLDINADIGTDEDIASISGLNLQVDARQVGTTNQVNGLNVVHYVGSDTSASELQNVNANLSYVEVQDQAEVTGAVTIHNDIVNSDAGAVINQLNGLAQGGNIQGEVSNFLGQSTVVDIGSLSTSYSGLNAGGTIGLQGGLNAFNVNYNLTGSQAEGYGYYLINEGTTFAELNSYAMFSHHVNGTTVRNDFNLFDGSGHVGTIGRNANLWNIHQDFDEVNGSFIGISEGSNVDQLVGGALTSFQTNTRASVPGDAYMYAAFPQITQRAASNQITQVTAEADVAGSLGGDYLRTCSAYSENPNQCIKVWFDVDNGSTPPSADGDTLVEVDITADASADDVATAAAAAIDGLAKFDASSAGPIIEIEVVANGRAGGVDTGGISGGWSWSYVQGGGGDGTLYGFYFGAGGSSGYGSNNIIAFDSGGYPVSFGRINAFTNYTIVPSTPNPANVHTIGANFSVGDSTTVSDGDVIGLGGIGTIAIGDGSTVTSGGLKVGATSAGEISLMQAGSGSTVENVTSDLAASILIAGSGTFTNVAGYRAVNANFGASTPMTNYRAFFADAPAGPGAATNTWALYADDTFDNYMGGTLKLGAGSDTAAKTLDVEGDAQIGDTKKVVIKADGRVKFPSFTTTERDALSSPEAGDTIYNSTTGALEYYDGAAWN